MSVDSHQFCLVFGGFFSPVVNLFLMLLFDFYLYREVWNFYPYRITYSVVYLSVIFLRSWNGNWVEPDFTDFEVTNSVFV